MENKDQDLFKGLNAVVQYKYKDCEFWLNMVAFDVLSVAEKYAEDCKSDTSPWEYRVIPVPQPHES